VLLDTYERELERYGGDAGIEACEGIFHADSICAIKIMQQFTGDAFADLRWRLTFFSTDCLLQDFGYSLEDRLRIATIIRNGFRTEFGISPKIEYLYGDRFRKERRNLETMLWNPEESVLKNATPAFNERSYAVKKCVQHLKIQESIKLDTLIPSLIHMSSNRLLRSAQRPQELAIADFLVRSYESKLARSRIVNTDMTD